MSSHLFDRWVSKKRTNVGRHQLVLLSETAGARSGVLDEIRSLVRTHYLDSSVTARRLASLGAPKAAQLLRERTPTTKRARSGDLGEILATEVAERELSYRVPIRRLRWKDGREMALRGDDIIGIAHKKERLRMLKGESKSRAALSSAVLDQAAAALDSDLGRPTRHAVLFVAERLRERGEDDVAEELEEAVLGSFRRIPVAHMLFILTGGDPEKLLTAHLTNLATKRRVRHAVGFWVLDHSQFVETLFGGL